MAALLYPLRSSKVFINYFSSQPSSPSLGLFGLSSSHSFIRADAPSFSPTVRETAVCRNERSSDRMASSSGRGGMGTTGFGVGSGIYKAGDKPESVAQKAKLIVQSYDAAQ